MHPVTCKPKRLGEFIGQDILKRQLEVEIKAAKLQRRATRPMLFSGPGGLGKTALAKIIHREMGNEADPTIITGKEVNHETLTDVLLAQESPGYDRSGNIISPDQLQFPIVVVDECESVSREWLEVLHPLLTGESRRFFGRDGHRTQDVWIIHTGFIFITNYLGKLVRSSEATVTRFGINHTFQWYSEDEIVQVIGTYAQRAQQPISPAAIKLLASRSNGVPRTAEKLFDRAWSYAVANGRAGIDEDTVKRMLDDVIGDNGAGLSREMVTYLTALNECVTGKMSLQSLAGVMGTDDITLMVIVEPPLLKRGLIIRSSNGRQITDQGRQALTGQSVALSPFFRRAIPFQRGF